ncbi:MAG TPA: flagellar biosynthetic protein FliR [Ignavibacteriales bacterium]|jgi:flagellar biosynthetic protein FliR|nr:flagellar biosynthetic protein FliR [Ignavibacteriales bacterium]
MILNVIVTEWVILVLITMRVIAAMVVAPPYNSNAIPPQARFFIALIIAYLTYFSIDKSTINIQISIGFLFFTGLKEIITGLIIGFFLNFVFYGISYAGMLIGFDMGLTMATVFNPQLEIENNVIGSIILYLSLLIFILINGHHYVIEAVVYSFKVIPIGKYPVNEWLYKYIVQQSSLIFVIAVKIAAPIMVSFFLVNIAEGIMSRVVPQMQVFFVTQPLRIMLGFFILITVIPIYTYVIKNLLQHTESSLLELINQMIR